MEKNLKTILELRNQIIKLYDNQRFRETNESYHNPELRMQERKETFEIAQNLKEQSTELLQQLLGDYMPVIAMEKCIIEPGETKRLKTNILQYPVQSEEENELLEFSQEGIISTYGNLTFSLEKDFLNGNRIIVTNNVPKKVLEEYDLGGYHYENPTTTRYCWAGVYRIEKGQMLGIIGKSLEENEEFTRKREFSKIYEEYKKSI